MWRKHTNEAISDNGVLGMLIRNVCGANRGRKLLLSIAVGATATFVRAESLRAQSFNCVMDPAQVVEVAATNAGVLSEVLVSRGDVVQKGQPVAAMNSKIESATLAILEARAESSAQIEAQEAQLAFVAAQLERVQRLVEQNAQSAVRLEELEYEYALAQSQLSQAENQRLTLLAELERAQIALDNTIILAPVSGRVMDIILGPGEYAGQERHIMEIAQLDPLHVEAYLPISLYPTISEDSLVTIRPDAPIEGEYQARISAVDTIFDTASRTFGIRVTLPNPSAQLPAGHRCQLDINTEG